MEKWNYRSLEWIHKVREENYMHTKNLSSSDILSNTFQKTKEVIKQLNLKGIKKESRVLV